MADIAASRIPDNRIPTPTPMATVSTYPGDAGVTARRTVATAALEGAGASDLVPARD